MRCGGGGRGNTKFPLHTPINPYLYTYIYYVLYICIICFVSCVKITFIYLILPIVYFKNHKLLKQICSINICCVITETQYVQRQGTRTDWMEVLRKRLEAIQGANQGDSDEDEDDAKSVDWNE